MLKTNLLNLEKMGLRNNRYYLVVLKKCSELKILKVISKGFLKELRIANINYW